MKEYKPVVYYNEIGDNLDIIWDRNVAQLACWKNKYVTILRSAANREKIIGVQITGFRRLFKHAGVRIDPSYEEDPATPDEMREAYDIMKKAGFDVPDEWYEDLGEPKLESVAIQLSDEKLAKLSLMAHEKNMTLNDFIVQIVKDYLSER